MAAALRKARQEKKRCATLEKRRRQLERNLQRKRRRQQKTDAGFKMRRYTGGSDKCSKGSISASVPGWEIMAGNHPSFLYFIGM